MIKKGTAFLFGVIILFMPGYTAGAEAVLFPGRVEFRGVINISGAEIVKKAGIKRSGSGIVVDMDLLKKVMDENLMVSSYTIENEKGNLVINVQEKYPLFMFFIVDKDLSVPALADENMNIIVSGSFFSTDMPIIIVKRQLFEQGMESSDLESLLGCLKQVRSGNSMFCREIREIEVVEGGSLRVFLKNRRTLFIISNDVTGFRRLEKTAGYLDIVSRYPDFMDLREDRVLVR